ncbi:MAG: histidine--tRNA ligase [Candidatus Gastranaerophilales bacterium]|nr:histidine--tRNA ligase [Candidatus Gastranaerophilales bacterium]
MAIKAQKGTKDVLPEEYTQWKSILAKADEIFTTADFRQIETPIFEATELFQRGVGDSTDIVNKEMYTFEKSDRSLTLRPENTAGVVRAYLEHGMSRDIQPVKLWYFGPMFRYERPQAGRQRQFHQIGVEMFGVEDASADADCIYTAVKFFESVGLQNLSVELNSLGCNSCRDKFRAKIKTLLEPVLDKLCEDCQKRFVTNPLRILDCKSEDCKRIFEENKILENLAKLELCEECSEHYNNLKVYLDMLNVKYVENPFLVRGLDYYTRTVFEIKSESLGSQNAVCGGGRYDNLVETLGGQHTPAIGWAVGMERLYSLTEKAEPQKVDYFVVSDNIAEALKLANEIRKYGKIAEFDYSKRKFAKQIEKAAKIAKNAVIIGETEIEQNTVSVKNLSTFKQKTISREEFFANISR